LNLRHEMKVIATPLKEVVLLEPVIHADARGITYEAYNRRTLREVAGIDAEFVQDNRSRSAKHVLRGLHYQLGEPQGKLVGALTGTIFDVAVDLRRGSPQFGKWTGFELSGENRRLAWIPPGFGHGFLVLSEAAEVIYKMSAFWQPKQERVIRWDDPDIGVAWPLAGARPVLSPRDADAPSFRQAEVFP
jgi:dTDP-4-dehydrorhamnose 3,5-epimerase